MIFQPPLKKGIEVFGIIFKGGQQAAEFHHIGRLYPAKVFEPCRVQISAGGDTLFATNAVREVLITFSNE